MISNVAGNTTKIIRKTGQSIPNNITNKTKNVCVRNIRVRYALVNTLRQREHNISKLNCTKMHWQTSVRFASRVMSVVVDTQTKVSLHIAEPRSTKLHCNKLDEAPECGLADALYRNKAGMLEVFRNVNNRSVETNIPTPESS
jgi:hypothetical protein